MRLETQFITLLLMFASGHALGILFDIYRVISGQLRLNRLVISLLDILYWIAATLLVFIVLFHSNEGDLRIYVFSGLFTGIWLYFRFFSPWTIVSLRFIIRMIRLLVGFICNVIHLVVITPLFWLYKFLVIFLGFLAAISIFLGKIVIQCCYPMLWIINRIVLPHMQRMTVFSRTIQWMRAAWSRVKRWFTG